MVFLTLNAPKGLKLAGINKIFDFKILHASGTTMQGATVNAHTRTHTHVGAVIINKVFTNISNNNSNIVLICAVSASISAAAI